MIYSIIPDRKKILNGIVKANNLTFMGVFLFCSKDDSDIDIYQGRDACSIDVYVFCLFCFFQSALSFTN